MTIKNKVIEYKKLKISLLGTHTKYKALISILINKLYILQSVLLREIFNILFGAIIISYCELTINKLKQIV